MEDIASRRESVKIASGRLPQINDVGPCSANAGIPAWVLQQLNAWNV